MKYSLQLSVFPKTSIALCRLHNSTVCGILPRVFPTSHCIKLFLQIEVKKLDGLLQDASDDRDAELNKKNTEIKKLKSDLAQLQRTSNEVNKRIKSDSHKQEATDVKTSDGKCDRLKQSIAQLRQQLAQAVSEHRQSEQVKPGTDRIIK